MKQLIGLIFFACFFTINTSQAQDKSKWKDLDKSPLDMAHYPANSAWRNYLSGDDRNKQTKIKVAYSRPSKNGRDIFGSLLTYGKEWRLGANEATEITFYQDVEVGGKFVPRGIYTMFATPNDGSWTISFSSQKNIWGGTNRDATKTVATYKVKTEKLDEVVETLSMTFQRVDDESVNMVIAWDKTQVSVPIGFNPINFEEMDKSPMDRVHYPRSSSGQNYLKPEELEGAAPKIRVTYSRPQKKGRKVFGELLKYGEVWRVGANQSTEIDFYTDVTIKGTKVKRGTYNVFAIVNEGSWDIILNTDRPSWGAANRDETKDVAKINVPVSMDTEDLEVLNILLEEKSDKLVHMVIAWEKHRVEVPIEIE